MLLLAGLTLFLAASASARTTLLPKVRVREGWQDYGALLQLPLLHPLRWRPRRRVRLRMCDRGYRYRAGTSQPQMLSAARVSRQPPTGGRPGAGIPPRPARNCFVVVSRMVSP